MNEKNVFLALYQHRIRTKSVKFVAIFWYHELTLPAFLSPFLYLHHVCLLFFIYFIILCRCRRLLFSYCLRVFFFFFTYIYLLWHTTEVVTCTLCKIDSRICITIFFCFCTFLRTHFILYIPASTHFCCYCFFFFYFVSIFIFCFCSDLCYSTKSTYSIRFKFRARYLHTHFANRLKLNVNCATSSVKHILNVFFSKFSGSVFFFNAKNGSQVLQILWGKLDFQFNVFFSLYYFSDEKFMMKTLFSPKHVLNPTKSSTFYAAKIHTLL